MEKGGKGEKGGEAGLLGLLKVQGKLKFYPREALTPDGVSQNTPKVPRARDPLVSSRGGLWDPQQHDIPHFLVNSAVNPSRTTSEPTFRMHGPRDIGFDLGILLALVVVSRQMTRAGIRVGDVADGAGRQRPAGLRPGEADAAERSPFFDDKVQRTSSSAPRFGRLQGIAQLKKQF